jgi:hypothetical protein
MAQNRVSDLRTLEDKAQTDAAGFMSQRCFPPPELTWSTQLTSSDEPAVSVYGRQLLLLGPKRNSVLELWEVQRYGTDTFGNPDYLRLYGLSPAVWYARGIRVLGRTAVECTPDHVADTIGRDVAQAAGPLGAEAIVIDPFVGSANTLYWIMQNLPGARCIGFELDPQVCRLTQQNLSILGLPIEVSLADYVQALRHQRRPPDALVIAFIAPPWGEAFTPSHGLDLRRTAPPVREIVGTFLTLFTNPLLLAVQLVQNTLPALLTELKSRFDWSVLHIYDSSKSTDNRNGLLLAGRGWRPDSLTTSRG